MTIRRLPESLINRIAAGEVVERPASAVKELVENSIDAGSRRIDVSIRDGGKSLISVSDDGFGMTPEELTVAIERHATSKLSDDDLFDIHTMGFRGEALPSLGSVSRLSIVSRSDGSDSAWSILVEGGKVSDVTPAAHPRGTRVDIRDLFYATPARLKFLKGDRSETGQILDVMKRLAMARPDVSFTLQDDGREKLRCDSSTGDLLDARLARLGSIMGREFADNALPIDAEREGIRLTGYAGLPTLNRANAQQQYLFVNGRPVRDKLLHGAVRGAYMDFLASNRHPMVALFVEIDPHSVDVNVHPAKAEVRFRDAGLVRGLIVGSLKHALAEAGAPGIHNGFRCGAGCGAFRIRDAALWWRGRRELWLSAGDAIARVVGTGCRVSGAVRRRYVDPPVGRAGGRYLAGNGCVVSAGGCAGAIARHLYCGADR